VLDRERLAVDRVHQPDVGERRRERQRGVVAALGVGLEGDEAGGRPHARALQELGERQTGQAGVEAGPAGDAVDVDGALAFRQREVVRPGKGERPRDEAADLELPAPEVERLGAAASAPRPPGTCG
jgi:hypothetical protein